MNRLLIRFFPALLIFLSVCVFSGQPAGAQEPDPPPPPPVSVEDARGAEAAVRARINGNPDVLAFLLYDVVFLGTQFSEDGNWALVTLAFADRDTGELLPTETGLAIAYRAGEGWAAALQSDPEWAAVLDSVPEDLLSAEAKEWYRPPEQPRLEANTLGTVPGFKLPWQAGQQKYLSRSVSHYFDYGGTDSLYAWDFYDGTRFPIRASRAGYVQIARWNVEDDYHDPGGDCNIANYIVIRDQSTSTSHVYLHLAHESIPAALRNQGAQVYRGQFIGNAGNTGCSSGNHLHFQVHTNPYSWWGTSIDITFDDVSINGGRPCTTAEIGLFHCAQGQNQYISGNTSGTDFIPPIAGMTAPADQSTVSGSTVTLSGWAADSETGLGTAYFIANYGNGWQQIGPSFRTSPFSYEWNLCNTGVGAGPVSIAVRAWDNDGNVIDYGGFRGFTHTSACSLPTPACSVTADQVALFSQPYFGGTCVTYTRPSGGELWQSSLPSGYAASILVGSNIRATLYTGSDYYQRSETFSASDRNLADNPVGSDTTRSLVLVPKSRNPNSPEILWPVESSTFSAGDSFLVAWRGHPGSEQFGFDITPAGYTIHPPAQTLPYLMLEGDKFQPSSTGCKFWEMFACNNNCSLLSSWVRGYFTVVAAPTPPAPVAPPSPETFEGSTANWVLGGLWRLATNFGYGSSRSMVYNDGTDFNNGSPNAGFLTSPAYSISAGQYLRFRYYYQAENASIHWDQRWVQISHNGGPFTNVLWLRDDASGTWRQSPPIDLSAYAGGSIRVRFYFATLDDRNNDLFGWAIDNLEINTTAAPACSDANEPNNDAASATLLAAGSPLNAQICAAGDYDYYRFTGTAGSRMGARLSNYTALSPRIEILDADGATLLAAANGASTSAVIPANGTYYIKVRSQNHPSSGGTDHGYTIALISDSTPPAISFAYPAGNNAYLPGGTVTVSANVSDAGGIEKVEFFRHNANWGISGAWVLICTDTSSAGGWSCALDTSTLTEGAGNALYVRATDWAGNQSAVTAWNLTKDQTAPALTLTPLTDPSGSTMLRLQWTASDSGSGIDRFRIEVNADGGGWAVWQSSLPAGTTRADYVGQLGHSYAFRVTAYDIAGNSVQQQTSASVQTCGADSYEPDSGSGEATPLAIGEMQTHNFCPGGDADWVSFPADAGTTYLVRGMPTGPTTSVSLSLFGTDGVTLLRGFLNAVDSVFFGAAFCWEAPANGTYYLRAVHPNPLVAGPGVSYWLNVAPGYCVHLPMLFR